MTQRNVMMGTLAAALLLGAAFLPTAAAYALPDGAIVVDDDAVDGLLGDETIAAAVGAALGAAGTVLGAAEDVGEVGGDAVAIGLGGAYSATGPAGEASCSRDPCGAAKCDITNRRASAHAVGSQDAVASARAGDRVAHQHGPPQAHAVSNGPGRLEAYGHGYKDGPFWSQPDHKATCFVSASDNPSMQSSSGPVLPLAAVGCVADETLTATQSFAGELFVAADGGVVAYDAATGQGISLAPEAILDGTSLQSLAPVDVAGLTGTGVRLGVDMVAEDGVRSCTAGLFA